MIFIADNALFQLGTVIQRPYNYFLLSSEAIEMPAQAPHNFELLRKRANTCRTYMLKDLQKLSKLRWDLGTAAYRQHALELEVISMARTNGFAPMELPFSNNSLKGKCLTMRKLLLKEEQKLAKKKWELACCNAKKDALDLLA